MTACFLAGTPRRQQSWSSSFARWTGGRDPAQSSLALEWETALQAELGKLRYLTRFGTQSLFVFDTVPYGGSVAVRFGCALRAEERPVEAVF